MTLTPPGAEVLTIEYKVNFLSPGQGDQLRAQGRVMKPGRTVTVCTGDVFVVREGQEKLVATMLVTMMAVGGQRDLSPNPSMSHLRETVTHRQSHSPRWVLAADCVASGRPACFSRVVFLGTACKIPRAPLNQRVQEMKGP